MDFKLIVSREAHLDIQGITEYIAGTLCNPQAAARFLDDVEKSYRRIAKDPQMYSLCKDA